eukprot:Seg3104.3 transcript_id=Seg3104.3/GoldUCD/mRNA.D3Y31 product="Transcription factor AP-1" protein_id=Seg3104.3/GoldUCD/D3Y31
MDIHGGIPAQFLLYDPASFRDFNQHAVHNAVTQNHIYASRKTRDTLNLKLDPDPIPECLSQVFDAPGHSPILGSPELNLLKLGSPELERLIMAQQGDNGIHGPDGIHAPVPRRGSSTPSLMSQLEMNSNRNSSKMISPIISNDDFQFITETNQALEAILPRSNSRESRGCNDSAHLMFGDSMPLLESLQEVPDEHDSERPLRMKSNVEPEAIHSRQNYTRKHEGHDKRDQLQGTSSSPESMLRENTEQSDMNSMYERMAKAERMFDNNGSLVYDLSQPSMVSNHYSQQQQHLENDNNSGLSILPMPPIDLEVQEIVKRERKKLKNRVAASKCRKKKLEREAQLEVRVQHLKEKNIELNALANALRQQAGELKQRIMEHMNSGCAARLMHY